MVDKIIEKSTGMKGIVVTIEIGICQEKRTFYKELMVIIEIEALAMTDLDQGL